MEIFLLYSLNLSADPQVDPQFFRPSPCRRLRRICISRAGFASANGMQKRPGLEGPLGMSASYDTLREKK